MEYVSLHLRIECDEKTSISKTTGLTPTETIISASNVYGDTLLAYFET